MEDLPTASAPVVVVTGANGLVGSRTCAALAGLGATVRAVVRREGAAPDLAGVEEHVGDFTDPAFATDVVVGADAVVTTVHPMGSDRETQRRVGVEGTAALARAARDAGVRRLVHVSTAAVYDRSPGVGDVDESSPLVGDDGNDYAVTKRDADRALAEVAGDGLSVVLLRPPAILGRGESSVWNTLRPAEMREDPAERRANPAATFSWVHVDDLARLAADVASGQVLRSDQSALGPVEDGCTAVNVTAAPATARDYYTAVTGALGLEPEWTDEEAWTGRLVGERARGWGWEPEVGLDDALAELRQGLA
ncbi:SDR family NAD(P)-dependent oxidoreductase [Nocardioides aestuarii]|uniref:NAD-dependent epimerase/dehydratase family protein n=1 Tax=Nocardioides aestuarii TaxID=252231 RepID=A0ABW4THL6_9ACTN